MWCEMDLKFPNARLFLHELLSSNNLSGAEAIAEGACHFGLISSESALDVQQPAHGNQCQCMVTAKNVMRQYFEQRPDQSSRSLVDLEEVWSAIEKHLSAYRRGTKTGVAETSDSVSLANTCGNHAAALFDMMLQQIRRYP
jgi:hypothetical protein